MIPRTSAKSLTAALALLAFLCAEVRADVKASDAEKNKIGFIEKVRKDGVLRACAESYAHLHNSKTQSFAAADDAAEKKISEYFPDHEHIREHSGHHTNWSKEQMADFKAAYDLIFKKNFLRHAELTDLRAWMKTEFKNDGYPPLNPHTIGLWAKEDLSLEEVINKYLKAYRATKRYKERLTPQHIDEMINNFTVGSVGYWALKKLKASAIAGGQKLANHWKMVAVTTLTGTSWAVSNSFLNPILTEYFNVRQKQKELTETVRKLGQNRKTLDEAYKHLRTVAEENKKIDYEQRRGGQSSLNAWKIFDEEIYSQLVIIARELVPLKEALPSLKDSPSDLKRDLDSMDADLRKLSHDLDILRARESVFRRTEMNKPDISEDVNAKHQRILKNIDEHDAAIGAIQKGIIETVARWQQLNMVERAVLEGKHQAENKARAEKEHPEPPLPFRPNAQLEGHRKMINLQITKIMEAGYFADFSQQYADMIHEHVNKKPVLVGP